MHLLSATIEVMEEGMRGEGWRRSNIQLGQRMYIFHAKWNFTSNGNISCKLLFTGKSVAFCLHVKVTHISVTVARTLCLFKSFGICKGRNFLRSYISHHIKSLFPPLSACLIIFNATINNKSVKPCMYLSTQI